MSKPQKSLFSLLSLCQKFSQSVEICQSSDKNKFARFFETRCRDNVFNNYGVRVITELYFVIFAAFKESMTLNLAQRSFKVIHFGGNRKLVYNFIYRPLVAFTLSSTVSEILQVL